MRAIIIHGTKGTPQSNWFPWLSGKLGQLGIQTTVPEMPTPENQSLESWHAAFKTQCGGFDTNTILIGHSCGAVFIMRLLEQASTKTASTILIAPPFKEIGDPEYDLLNSSFLESSFDWAKIRSNSGTIHYLMGDNDPYVPQEQLLHIASSLQISPIIISGGGHLNAESGFTEFPLLLKLIQETHKP